MCDAVGKRYPLVLAYYDNLDKIAHEFGIGPQYRTVLAAVEQLSGALRAALPPEVPLAVTADHGVVEVLDPPIMVDADIVALASGWSGEARMLWLHARIGAADDLLEACGRYESSAEIAPLSQVLDEQWLGRHVTAPARARLGDVVLVPRALDAFTMPDDRRAAPPADRPPRGAHSGGNAGALPRVVTRCVPSVQAVWRAFGRTGQRFCQIASR